MFCQRCGKRNDPDAESCKFCKAPLFVVRPDRSTSVQDLQPFLGIEEYVMDKISTVEKQATRSSEDLNLLIQAVDFLERNTMVNRAGINVLVQMLRERGILASAEFDARWREKTLLNLGGLYRRERFLDAKPHILTAFKGKNRRRFEERLARAEDLLYSFRSQQAVQVLEEAATLDPSNPPLLAYLGEAHLSLGRKQEASKRLSAAVALNERSSGALLAYAQIQVASGRLVETAKLLEEILKRDAESAEAWTLLALTRGLQGDWKQCRGAAEKALALEENPAALLLLAHVLLRQKKAPAALLRLEQLLELCPDSEEALVQTAVIYLAKGWWGRAGELLGRVRALDPASQSLGLPDEFKRLSPAQRRARMVREIAPEPVLALMDTLSEEAKIYLGQAELEE
jgi:tetratricopeptide (TPR) repeat protein